MGEIGHPDTRRTIEVIPEGEPVRRAPTPPAPAPRPTPTPKREPAKVPAGV